MSNQTETKPETTHVVASVNDKRLLSSLKHLFASSFSMLGELMQNARRAGATRVDFLLDTAKRELSVIDDGRGIQDFSTLVALCESDWSEATTLTEKPFGMGFFSVFYACEKVTIKSNGSCIEATLDDIVSKRKIEVVPTDYSKGTCITLHGLSKDLLECGINALPKAVEDTNITSHLKRFSRGFPIPVALNGVEYERPHAMDKIETVMTEFGHIHDHLITAGETRTANSLDNRGWAYYLQGLPIEATIIGNEPRVVHLDSTRFIAQMPDRKALYDGDKQLAGLKQAHRNLVVQMLVSKKATMPEQAFVQKYWAVCKEYGAMELMNSIPYLPSSLLSRVDAVDYRGFDAFGNPHELAQLLTRDEIIASKVQIWSGAAGGSYEAHEQDGVLLKMMQRHRIYALDANHGLSDDHWLFEHVMDWQDLEVSVSHSDVIGKEVFYIRTEEVLMKVVDSVTVKVTSTVDPDFKLEETITGDWIAYSDENEGEVCLVTRNNNAGDEPIDFYTDHCNEHDAYNDSARDDLLAEWNSTVSGILGATLASLVKSDLSSLRCSLQDANAGQLALVYGVSSWRPHLESYSVPRLRVVDLESPQMWDYLAKQIGMAGEIDGEALKAAFASAFGVTKYEGGPGKSS